VADNCRQIPHFLFRIRVSVHEVLQTSRASDFLMRVRDVIGLAILRVDGIWIRSKAPSLHLSMTTCSRFIIKMYCIVMCVNSFANNKDVTIT